jgi:hypothetical protein
MNNTSTTRLAIWSGVFAEVAFCSILALTEFFTRHPDAYRCFAIFHLPGFWLAAHLGPMRYILVLPFAILSGIASFAIIFWASIWLWRLFCQNNSPPNHSAEMSIS